VIERAQREADEPARHDEPVSALRPRADAGRLVTLRRG
jgi:hypothetical protein